MSSGNAFLKLRYVGTRFEQNSIPLAHLGELAALQRALNELYRAQFRAENAGRKRVPKGYKDVLLLALASIERGSAIACLEAPLPYQTSLSEEMGDALSRSVQSFLDFIEDQGDQARADVQRVMTACVKELGSSLRDDETIFIERGERTVRYDQDVRKNLLQKLNSSFSRTGEQVFTVSEFNKKNKTFDICQPNGATCEVSYAGNLALEKTAYEAFDGFKRLDKNAKVLVSGEFTYDRNGILTKVIPEAFEILGERDLRWRIPFLQHRNAADSIALETLRSFERLWQDSFNAKIQDHPSLYLLSNEMISAEWDLPGGEVTMSYSVADGFTLLDLESDEELLVDSTDLPKAVGWLVRKLGAAVAL